MGNKGRRKQNFICILLQTASNGTLPRGQDSRGGMLGCVLLQVTDEPQELMKPVGKASRTFTSSPSASNSCFLVSQNICFSAGSSHAAQESCSPHGTTGTSPLGAPHPPSTGSRYGPRCLVSNSKTQL